LVFAYMRQIHLVVPIHPSIYQKGKESYGAR
jgi:hypothetical protein